MSSEDAENDHAYAASRQRNLEYNNSDDDFEIPITRSSRRIPNLRIWNYNIEEQNNEPGTSTSGNTSNRAIIYRTALATVPVHSASNSTMSSNSGGSMEGDHDIFNEEDNDDADEIPYLDSTSQASVNTIATIYSLASAGSDHMSNGSTVESDSRSEASVSTVTTSSSEETNSTSSSTGPHPEIVPEENSDRVIDIAAIAERDNVNNNESIIIINSPSPPKKRKRLSLEPTQNSGTPKVKQKNQDDLDDEDDGLTCPICLDNWEMSGEHRLSSLKCGHLFGESCIRRWLLESSRQSGQKVCPQCKTKANPKDIRYLYAKRLRAIDRSEEHRLRDQVNAERSRSQNLELELATLKMTYAQVTQKLKTLEADNDSLNILLRSGVGYESKHTNYNKSSVMYKLFMDRNIEISREPGCRVMKYAEYQASLLVSQKSSQGLFPGYGLRFVDTATFKPTNFLYTSIKRLRDISLSDDQQLLAAASMEDKVKLFDLRTLQVSATFKPSEKPIWSCAIGQRESEHKLYLGSQHGSTYVYDIRFPESIINEHQTEGDLSPVIQVASIPASDMFPFGGFMVCKLTSLWFYEHSGSIITNATRLPLEGRFISMDYDEVQQNLLVQTRSCMRHPRARYILGKLNKINNIPLFEIKVTFFDSTNSPIMARCSQIAVDSNTLVAAYIQDSKLLSLYDSNREQRIQSLPIQDVVYDTCPIYTKGCTYLAALTETKCRLYKLNTT